MVQVISMRLLFIHADYMEYELKDKTKYAEELPAGAPTKMKFDEVLVVFVSVEENDSKASDEIVQKGVKSILDVAGKLKTNSIVLYPYAHLSSELANPQDAQKIVKELESNLAKSDMTVHRSPFGWYKAFTLKCKGHPLSELSKRITPEEKGITREDIVENISSDYVILYPDGKETKVELNRDWVEKAKGIDESMRKYILSEELKAEIGVEPPSIKAMRQLELVDYEPSSDPGNFRLYPKGTLMFNLIKDWADWIAHEKLDAIEINTPILYDSSQPDINAQVKSFHQRHYKVSAGDDKREYILRFAGDFGLFRIMRDSNISYKQLPIRVYEFSKSFRYEQRGELLGLKRLRAFHMPDVHTFVGDIEQGWSEYELIYRTFSEQINRTGIEYVNVFHVVKEFYEQNKDKIAKLFAESGKPAFIEILSQAKHYWVIKNEFQGIDSTGRAYQLSTVQLDIEDAERYGIVYVDRDGKKKGCVITHSSIGSVERWIYGFLEEAIKKKQPYLPFWIAPVQVRLIPVDSKYIEDCVKLADTLGIRADIDDREEKISRKIRDAEKEWINMIIVYGEKEKNMDKLPVRMRNQEVLPLTVTEIKKIINGHMKDFPYRKNAVPRLLSKNIVFYG